ncbi:15543_t:CDS:2 [Acaulospora morrowiae]|uniref:15543_t:CDS:1 n=1 Tax=Acaulospora morrowiae TaxID=94023 RepID=A0A9N9BZM5_9GLOM|nr:15543_t:CDS:2 [Acaulospora morrowiae]
MEEGTGLMPDEIEVIVQERKEIRVKRIESILKEFDILETMIDSDESYVNLCSKYEQIYSLWVYVHRDFQPDELTAEEATVWRLMPAILLCYKHYLIRKRENMDRQGINMGDRPSHTLRNLPKPTRKHDAPLLNRMFLKLFTLLHLKSSKSNPSSPDDNTNDENKKNMQKPQKQFNPRLSIKKSNKLRRLSERELIREWRDLIMKFRKAVVACSVHVNASGKEVKGWEKVSTKKRIKWTREVMQLVAEIDEPSIIDEDVKAAEIKVEEQENITFSQDVNVHEISID